MKKALYSGTGIVLLAAALFSPVLGQPAPEPATLENNTLQVTLSPETGCFQVLEKLSGAQWRSDPIKDVAGELQIRQVQTGKVRTVELGRESNISITRITDAKLSLEFQHALSYEGLRTGNIRVAVTLELIPEKPEMLMTITDVRTGDDWVFQSLLYPARFGPIQTFEEHGYLAVPVLAGCIVPSWKFTVPIKRYAFQDDQMWSGRTISEQRYHGYGGLTMPWYGAVRDNSAFLCIIESYDDFSLHCILNSNLQHEFSDAGELSPHPRILTASPRWNSSIRDFRYPRTARYVFYSDGDYVDLAKGYRTYLREHSEFKTLQEKAAATPDVEKLYGAPMFNLISWGYPWYTDDTAFGRTWMDVEAYANDLHAAGLRHAFVQVWGGYATLPPESLPFEPKMGTLDDMRHMIDAVQGFGYLYATYHGYPALLEHDGRWQPDEAYRDVNGHMTPWRWGRRCSSFYMASARRNLPDVLAASGQNADYQDMLPHSWSECYAAHHPAHPMSREQCRTNILEVLQYSKSQGLVTGVETCMAWSVPYVDYAKAGGAAGKSLFGQFPVPLFGLVYHDALIRYAWTGAEDTHLQHLAFGVLPWLGPLTRQEKEQLHHLVPMMEFQQSVADKEMIAHTFLTDNMRIQETDYISGASVVTNLTREAYVLDDGRRIPASGFILRYPDGHQYTGSIPVTLPVSAE